MQRLEQRSAELRHEIEELNKEIEKHQRCMEKSMQKKAALTKRLARCSAMFLLAPTLMTIRMH